MRVVLIRRPGAHADMRLPRPRTVYLAATAPGQTALWQDTVHEPKHLLDLDFAAIGAGRSGGFGVRRTDPLLLVCTNGRRDLCCALLGREIAGDLAEHHRTLSGSAPTSAATGSRRPRSSCLPATVRAADVPSAEHVLTWTRSSWRLPWPVDVATPWSGAELAVRDRSARPTWTRCRWTARP